MSDKNRDQRGGICATGQYARATAIDAEQRSRLVVLEGPSGSVAIGHIAEQVVFICFVGEIPFELAARCARKLKRILARGSDFALFIDAHAPDGGNVEARNAIARAVVASRSRLASLVILVRAPFVEMSASALGSAFGAGALVTSDAEEFDELLIDAAPEAYSTINADNCVTAGPSTLPPIELIRSA